MIDSVECRRQIGVEYPPAVRVAPGHRAEDRLDRVMAATARPKAVGLRFEPRLPLRLQRTEDEGLQGPVRDDGNAERALTPVGLRYEHPLDGLGFPRLGPVLHPVGQLGLLGGKQRGLAVDPGRLAARVDLRDPPHAHQGVRAGAEHELLQIPGLARSPACVAVKMRCRRRRTSSSARCQSIDSQPVTSSSGPFTMQVSNLPFGSGSSQHRVLTGSPGHVSTLSGPGSRPYPAGYRGTDGGGAAHHVPRFPLPFGRRHSLLGHPVPAGGSAFLTVGPPALPGRIPSGFPRSAQLSSDRGGCPLYPGDGGVLPAGGSLSGRHLPLPCGQSLHPAGAFRLAGPKRDEASSRVHSRSPVRSSPCL